MTVAEAERLLAALGDAAQARGIGALSEEERTALIPWWAVGQVTNGGFQALFEKTYPVRDVARRFRAVGLDIAADACEQVLAGLFGEGPEPLDRQTRGALAQRVDWARFRPHDRVLQKIDWDELAGAIGRYMEAHPRAFGLFPN